MRPSAASKQMSLAAASQVPPRTLRRSCSSINNSWGSGSRAEVNGASFWRGACVTTAAEASALDLSEESRTSLARAAKASERIAVATMRRRIFTPIRPQVSAPARCRIAILPPFVLQVCDANHLSVAEKQQSRGWRFVHDLRTAAQHLVQDKSDK